MVIKEKHVSIFKTLLFLQTPAAVDRKQARIHTSSYVWRPSFPWCCLWPSRWFSTENFSSWLMKRWVIPLVDCSWDQTAIGSKQKMTSEGSSPQDVTKRPVHRVHGGTTVWSQWRTRIVMSKRLYLFEKGL